MIGVMTDTIEPKPVFDPIPVIERAIRLLQQEQQPSQGVATALALVEHVHDFLTRQKLAEGNTP